MGGGVTLRDRERARRRAAICAGVVLVLLAIALPVATAHARTPPGFFGISDPFPAGPSAKDLRRMGRGHLGWVHTGFVWAQLEPSRGQFDWNRSDAVVGKLASEGVRTLPYIYGSPRYAASAANRPPLGSNRAREDWSAFLRAAVNRYGPGGTYWTTRYSVEHPGKHPEPVSAWQVWHEPSLSKYFHGSAAKYAKLLRISHHAIHQADPHAKVILAGLPAYAKPTAWSFLRRLYEQKRIKRSFDGVAVHPYAPTVHYQAVALKRTRRVVKRHHDGHTPIWITEVGWGSRPPKTDRFHLNKGLHGQARYLKKTFRMVLHHRRSWNVKRVFWFRWRDPTQSKCFGSIACSAGLFKARGKPKPAWGAFERFSRR